MRIFFVLLLSMSFYQASWAKEEIVIAVRDDFSYSKLYVEILTEAYRRINQPVSFSYLPGGSSLKYSNSGELNIGGEAGRLAGVLNTYSNLRKIAVPIYYSELTIFSNNKNMLVNSWEELNEFNVVTRIGYKFVINKLKGQRLKVVENTDIALLLVNKNRADVAVLSMGDGIKAINRLKLDNVYPITPVLEKLPVFHMLNKRHESLIPKLELVLREMEKEGLLVKFSKKYE